MNILLSVAALLATLITTFLRSFQSKNVTGGYRKLAFFVGVSMSALDALVILLLAKNGFSLVPFSALGAGLGWVLGMVAHDRMTATARAERKMAKRRKEAARVQALLDELKTPKEK